jgi:sigma-B regulation protein RsbQ
MSVAQRNHVRISGRGTRPLLFSHGYGCDQNMWRLVAPAFEDDYKVVLFDHVGAGKSDTSAFSKTKYNTLAGYAQDVIEICDELELRDITFIGHSVSSMIGVLAAIQRPELFHSLVLVGPSPRYVNDGAYFGGFERKDIDGLLEMVDSNYLGWAAAITPAIMGNKDRPELAKELENSFCQTDPAIGKFFARVTFLSDNRADLAKIRIPTLVLQCSEDIIAPISVGEFVHREIANSELVIMKATGHCPNLSAPQETITAIRSFLARQGTDHLAKAGRG